MNCIYILAVLTCAVVLSDARVRVRGHNGHHGEVCAHHEPENFPVEGPPSCLNYCRTVKCETLDTFECTSTGGVPVKKSTTCGCCGACVTKLGLRAICTPPAPGFAIEAACEPGSVCKVQEDGIEKCEMDPTFPTQQWDQWH